MKKIILVSTTLFLTMGMLAQNCVQILPSTVTAIKSDGSHSGVADQLWICEDITYELIGNKIIAYVEKGGDITATGNELVVYMKKPGTLTIDGDDGFYTVDSSVVVSDNGNNNIIDICSVSMTNDPIVFDYKDITGIIDCIDTATTTGINTPIKKGEITLFPNPVRNILNVNVPSKTGPSIYRIYSVSGNVVLDGQMASSSEQIDMSGLERGLYFIEIQNQSGKVSKRISVE